MATVQRTSAASSSAPRGSNVPQGLAPLNPERLPALLAKWQKLLGKEIEKISVDYTADGVQVSIFGMEGTRFASLDKDGHNVAMSPAEFLLKKKDAVVASAPLDAIAAFKNKYELRLNKEFPRGANLGDGSEKAINSWLQTQPFQDRRVLLLSKKLYEKSYPNGPA
jgi:hypothetical protein